MVDQDRAYLAISCPVTQRTQEARADEKACYKVASYGNTFYRMNLSK